RLYVPAGLQVLDGRTALHYARSRHSSNDFDRIHRQQQVLQAILAEVRRRGILDQAALLPELAHDLEQSVTTTLPISDLSALHGLAMLAQALTPDQIVQLSINPNDVQVVAEVDSDIYWDKEDVAFLVARLLSGPSASAELARIQVQNGAGVQGLATRVTENLSIQGFLMTQAGDAPTFYEHTYIFDYTGRPDTRRRLADLLGIDPNYVQATPSPDAPPAPYRTDIVIVLGQDYDEQWAEIR
ncbi:MAG: LCP family protein, partial [Chloroflexales bacterium]|nr:LCP family protein [Chloroflexales bacterium]